MSYTLIRLVLAITFLFTISIVLIHAQPYDESELRKFFTPPDGCPAPCFMNIQPGITTAAEAGTIFQSHAWVSDFTVSFDTNSREGQLVWQWSGSQPAQIRDEVEGTLRICDSLICSLSIATRIPYGAILLAFGQPDSGTLRSLPDGQRTMIVFTALYDPFQLDIRTRGFCPPLFTAMALHQQLTTFHIGIVREQMSRSSLQSARFQVINFQKQSVSWLRRRGFVCPV